MKAAMYIYKGYQYNTQEGYNIITGKGAGQDTYRIECHEYIDEDMNEGPVTVGLAHARDILDDHKFFSQYYDKVVWQDA